MNARGGGGDQLAMAIGRCLVVLAAMAACDGGHGAGLVDATDAPVVDTAVVDGPQDDAAIDAAEGTDAPDTVDAAVDAAVPDAAVPDAATADAATPDGPAVSDAAVDAAATCATTAPFRVTGGTALSLEVAATPGGWLIAYRGYPGPSGYLTAVTTSGAVALPPTQVGTDAHVAVNGDRAMLVLPGAMQPIDLSGAVAGPAVTSTGSRAGMVAAAVAPGPGTGFRVLWALYQPASHDMQVEVATIDRDGALISRGPLQWVYGQRVVSMATTASGDAVAIYDYRRVVGGCLACDSDGMLTFAADGTIASTQTPLAGPSDLVYLGDVAQAGGPLFVPSDATPLLGGATRGSLTRGLVDTLYTDPASALAVTATGPTAGVLGAGATLQRFTDGATFALGDTCAVGLTVWKVRHQGGRYLVVDASGQAVVATWP